MRRPGAMRAVAFSAVLGFTLGACGGAVEDVAVGNVTFAPVPTAAPTTTQPPGPAIGVTGVSFGGVLVDNAGRTMYVFANDRDGVSSCYDECAVGWPPVPAGLVVVGDRIDVTLGESVRADGTTQLTVNGRPAYLFAGDNELGDINGQRVNGSWFVVGIDGEPITRVAGRYDY